MTQEEKGLLVVICRSPQSWEHGVVSVDTISHPHWSDISGGVQIPMGNYYLCGYIPYSVAVEEVACSGVHDRGYNEAKIVLCKSHNTGEYAAGYKLLAKLAGVKPKR